MARNLWLAGTSLPLHQQFFIIVLSSYQNFLLTNSCLMVFSQTLPNPIIFKPTLSPPLPRGQETAELGSSLLRGDKIPSQNKQKKLS